MPCPTNLPAAGRDDGRGGSSAGFGQTASTHTVDTMITFFSCNGKLTVVPDNTTGGSEGRLCLQLPEELLRLAGHTYKVLGNWGEDKKLLFIEHPDGKVVTPRRQIWWKNGVRDEKIRQNYHVVFYYLNDTMFLAMLSEPTDDPIPLLPMRQETFF